MMIRNLIGHEGYMIYGHISNNTDGQYSMPLS